MNGIRGLGYLGLGVSDLDAWESFATEILGLQSAGRADDGTLHLRMDEYEYRFALHRDASDDLAYVGWEVADASALREVADRLRAAGPRSPPAHPQKPARAASPNWFASPIRTASRARPSMVRRFTTKNRFSRRGRSRVLLRASRGSGIS